MAERRDFVLTRQSAWAFTITTTTSEQNQRAAEIVSEENFKPLEPVAAGHDGMQTNTHDGSLVIKPCTAAEIAFYESTTDHPLFQAHMPTFIGKLTRNNDQDPNDLGPLNSSLLSRTTTAAKRTSWQPSGGKKLDTGFAIVLENVAHNFTRPNVLDVKLGARLWADDAPASKRQKLDQDCKETTSGSLGFRIAGMKVWQPAIRTPNGKAENSSPTSTKPSESSPTHSKPSDTDARGSYISYDKSYGRSLTPATVANGFRAFLSSAVPPRNKLIASRLVREIRAIEFALQHEESRMYSTSVLMVYEGDPDALEVALKKEEEEEMAETAEAEKRARGDVVWDEDVADVGVDADDADDDDDDDDEEESKQPKVLDVRLIDFAHAEWTPGKGPDENVLRGLRNVKTILRELGGQEAW